MGDEHNKNPLEIEVPAWGSIFREDKIHPDNLLLESQEHKLRKLTRYERRKFSREKRRLNQILKRNNYAGMVALYTQLVNE